VLAGRWPLSHRAAQDFFHRTHVLDFGFFANAHTQEPTATSELTSFAFNPPALGVIKTLRFLLSWRCEMEI